MKLRVVALALGLAGLAAFLTRGAGPPARPRVRPAAASVPIDRPDALAEPLPAAVAPVRDPFRYADEPARPSFARSQPPPTAGAAAPSAPPVRLVGFVWQQGKLRAALSTAEGVVLAGAGEIAGGYLVMEVDEEGGVRLRDPAGEEIRLPAPP